MTVSLTGKKPELSQQAPQHVLIIFTAEEIGSDGKQNADTCYLWVKLVDVNDVV